MILKLINNLSIFKSTARVKNDDEQRCIAEGTPWQRRSVLDRVHLILGWTGGGVQKRIDENREMYQLLCEKAPEFMAKHPWVVGWIESNDEFFSKLAEQVPVESQRFRPTEPDWPGKPYPRLRPWPLSRFLTKS